MNPKDLVLAVNPDAIIIRTSSLAYENGYIVSTCYPDKTYNCYYVSRTEEDAWRKAWEYLECCMLRKLKE